MNVHYWERLIKGIKNILDSNSSEADRTRLPMARAFMTEDKVPSTRPARSGLVKRMVLTR